MKSFLFVLCLVLASNSQLLAQRSAGSLGSSALGLLMANEFSKEESLYKAKEFIMTSTLGVTDEPAKFETFALAAATSGELTSLVYRSEEKHKEGLLLAFYGMQVNEAGLRIQGYGFKDLPKAKAVELLARLDAVLEKHTSYLRSDSDNNNLYFKYDDLTFLLYAPSGMEVRMRVFWGQFDSEWNISAFHKTERRMAKKI